MATYDWTGTDIIPNGSGSAVRADLNDALLALFSQNSSATAPPETVAYMPWADTTNGLYKIRNAANSDWITELVCLALPSAAVWLAAHPLHPPAAPALTLPGCLVG
jgi:hypothetical protein